MPVPVLVHVPDSYLLFSKCLPTSGYCKRVRQTGTVSGVTVSGLRRDGILTSAAGRRRRARRSRRGRRRYCVDAASGAVSGRPAGVGIVELCGQEIIRLGVW